MNAIGIRLLLSVLIGIAGIVVIARVSVAAVVAREYAEAIPGVVLGGLLVLFGAYRIGLALRARDARRR